MIRCIRIWTDKEKNSQFEEGLIELKSGIHGDLLSGALPVSKVSFQETASGGAFEWHNAPVRQLVVTLKGILDFQTRGGDHFKISPGDILLAEDTTGSGHSWKLIGNDPWCRVYIVLELEAVVPFTFRSK